MAEEKTRRKSSKRRARMPAIVDVAIGLLKSAERQALLKGLEVQDPAVAEMLRVAAATYEAAAVLVLKAFDTVTQNPSL